MSISTHRGPDYQPETVRPGVTRREATGVIGLTGAMMAMGGVLLNPDSEKKKTTEQKAISLLGMPIKQRLEMNAEETEKIWRMKPQEYMKDLRKRGHRLLAEANPDEEKAECVDERQEDGITNCIAGLGVHTPAQRPAIAGDMIRAALAKYEAKRKKGIDKPIRIRLTWHGRGMCGAALLACKQDDPDKHFTPEEIDAKAENGAVLLGGEIEKQLKEMDMSHACIVSVEQVPPEQVMNPDGHPGRVILLDGDPDLEFNRDGEPLLNYGASFNQFGGKGISDAVLSAKIMMGPHGWQHVYPNGRHHGETHDLKEHEKPLYVLAGPPHIVKIMRNQLVRALQRLTEDEQSLLVGRIDSWYTK